MIKSDFIKPWLWHFICFALLVITVCSGTILYVSSEQYFHFWDFAAYQMWAQESFTAFSQSGSMGWQELQSSFSQSYNKLYTLPLIPGFWLFGETRLGYILSLAIAYLIPFTLAMGAIATQLIRIYPPLVFWSTVFFTLCIPATWLPTLRGYPDTGAAVFIALALWIYLKNTRLKYWWQIPLIGILLTLAFVWRRHFAYSGIALILTFIIQGILTYLKEKNSQSPKAINNLIEYQIKIALIGITSFFTLVLIARPYLLLALQRNHTTLYQSYVRPYDELLYQYLHFYGLSLLALSILGLVIAWGKLSRQPYRIVLIFYAICAIEWMGILRYGGLHHTLHLTPLVILGLISLVWVIIRATSIPIKTSLFWVIIGYLILNLTLSFTPLGQPFSRPPRNILFSFYSPPPYRSDYPELLRLVQALRRLAPNQEPLYLVGSSSSFNYSLIVSAEQELYGQDRSKLYIRQTPIVDSRDWYPLEQFLQAKYVIIAKPFQHHLTLEETDVEKVIYDIFDQNWQIAEDFEQLPLEFELENNTKLVIYQRLQNTSAEIAWKTFIQMQEVIGDRPGNQPPWVILNPNFETVILPQSDTYTLATSFNEQNYDQILDMLWINPLPAPFILTGKPVFSSNVCPEFNLRLSWINPQGESKILTETSLHFEDTSVFELPLQQSSEGYLNLSLRVTDPQDFTTTCHLRIDQLNLE
ncbi:hypothetical protein PMG71_01010 [Roseofilum sp. BLCC_M154]|uniref:Glycosyltransferase RgtA/B/C/D-like domain-containing protein n=1 Tax=Roseofilum acuticapitatum BLCC-M154 TaxID=3022444 RepID=A0ABT7AM78_9CYAN|nr:hypothetical protein [Roseofilum acuticapitatum]MDJ1168001.1 hypothetical protein [Roseofilum acuticapitatum BLCC-M154]